ncbi:MAG: hypothetical protein ACRBCS_06215 [Cellvibrionaceae bacterium]
MNQIIQISVFRYVNRLFISGVFIVFFPILGCADSSMTEKLEKNTERVLAKGVQKKNEPKARLHGKSVGIRVIIHFSSAITDSEKNDIKQFFQSYQVEEIHLASPSHDKRWVVILPDTFMVDALPSMCDSLSKKPYVLAAEPDRLMKKNNGR